MIKMKLKCKGKCGKDFYTDKLSQIKCPYCGSKNVDMSE